MDMSKSIVGRADSYKPGHWLQYPEGFDGYFGYIEARGGEWPVNRMLGPQFRLQEMMENPVTMEQVEFFKDLYGMHGVPFNYDGWKLLVQKYGGLPPVTIRAIPDGTVLPVSNALVTVESDTAKKDLPWIGSYMETDLLRSTWYGTTVATLSYHCRKIIKEEMELTCDDLTGLPFKLHDFGARGVSSAESARIGGLAHLSTGALGTDTVEALIFARQRYACEMAGFSIPASEHSTITAWGMTKEDEIAAYGNMLKVYAKPGTILACVSDSTDVFWACREAWGTIHKQQIIDSGATLVVRPDSGDPEEVTLKCIEILGEKFGYKLNSKGFRVLNNVRLIQGDGVNERSIKNILANFRVHGWSADNIAFGMGGALLQGINRDTCKFAMKCSAIRVNGDWRDVQKNPITDSGKRSKKGRLSTYKLELGDGQVEWRTLTAGASDGLSETLTGGAKITDMMHTIYKNGELFNIQTLDQIRSRDAL